MTWLCNRRKGRKRKRRGCFGIECKSIIVIKEIFKRVEQHWYEEKLKGTYPWQVKYGKQRKYIQQQIMRLQKSKKKWHDEKMIVKERQISRFWVQTFA